MHEELKELGLTENESKIYIYLLKNNNSTTGPIIKNTKIANSRVYESLNTLMQKGLVTYNTQKDGKHFSATEPETLLQQEEERKKKIESIIPQLNQLKTLSKTPDVNTAIYEGFTGFKTAFRKIIEDCPEKGEILILGFSDKQYAHKSLRTFIQNMNLKAIDKRQRLKILLDKENKQSRDRKKEPYTEIRYMPKGYISPAAIDIFEDYTYIFLWEEKPYVFMIKNKQIAESFKSYFEFLWRIAKT